MKIDWNHRLCVMACLVTGGALLESSQKEEPFFTILHFDLVILVILGGEVCSPVSDSSWESDFLRQNTRVPIDFCGPNDPTIDKTWSYDVFRPPPMPEPAGTRWNPTVLTGTRLGPRLLS